MTAYIYIHIYIYDPLKKYTDFNQYIAKMWKIFEEKDKSLTFKQKILKYLEKNRLIFKILPRNIWNMKILEKNWFSLKFNQGILK